MNEDPGANPEDDDALDYPQQQREWRGGFWNIVVPLVILGCVAAALVIYFSGAV